MAQAQAISYPRKYKYFIIADHTVSQFSGLDTIEPDLQKIPDGYTPDSMNWITGDEKDCIILRRGTNLLGQTRQTGAGKITGLGVGIKQDGTQIPFWTHNQKVKYYKLSTDDSVEIGSDVLPAAAATDIFSVFPYQNLAGNYVYISSPNSDIYKICVANPDTIIPQLSTDFKGFLRFGQSRSILTNRKGSNGKLDATNLFMSFVDAASLATSPPFTLTSGESVGSSGATHYTHTLANITGVRSAAQVQVSATVAAGTETFVDDRNGNLASNFGGTGTVNYATGAIVVDFSAVTTGAVTVTYYYETATSHSIADFSFTSPTRVPGEGRFYSQFDGGGNAASAFPLSNIFYTFHKLKTWQTSVPTDDNDAGTTAGANLPFREKMGMTSPLGAFAGALAIYYVNNANPALPEIYALKPRSGSSFPNVAQPTLISKLLNLSSYVFDQAVVFEWAQYVLVCCQQIRNGVTDNFNSRTFVYNKRTGTWDLTDYPATQFAEYAGTLLAGDTLTNNVFTLFSGFDDDGYTIPNYWTSGYTNLAVRGMKSTQRMVVNGLIQKEQSIAVDIAMDGGAFVNTFTIQGTGSYIDSGRSIAVGSYVVGSKVAGGGQTVFANPFEVEFALNTDRYEWIRVRFRAMGGGYAQINYYSLKMNKFKGESVPPQRMVG